MSFGTLSRRIPFVIPSGVPLQLVAHGEKFWIENATGRLNVEVGDGNSATVRAGFESPDLARFSKLVLTNETASEIRGVIWVGARGVKFSYPQNSPVLLRSFSANYTTTVSRENFPGFADNSASYATAGIEPGSRRAFFLISHRTTSSPVDLLLRDVNDVVFHAITANSQQLIPIDTFFKVSLSAGSSGIDWTVGEFFHA